MYCAASFKGSSIHSCPPVVCQGTMQLQLTAKGTKSKLFSWISKHAVLLKSPGHEVDTEPQRFPRTKQDSVGAKYAAAAAQLAAGLAGAAVLPDGLKLRSLATFSLPVLWAASCSSLTCLNLDLYKNMLFASAHEATTCITGVQADRLRHANMHHTVLVAECIRVSAMLHTSSTCRPMVSALVFARASVCTK